MPQAQDINDPARWRVRAAEFRELAEDISDEQLRQSIAKSYEHVAEAYGALIFIAIIVAAFAILMLV